MNFEEFNLDGSLLEGLSAIGFETATPIQEAAIPAILDKKDVIACAQTGTGKTAAFVLPILHQIANENPTGIDTLIISPTRELALQIDQQVEGLGYFTGASSKAIYGGGDGDAWEKERKALMEGADIIIATPGKLLSFLKQKIGNFTALKHLVLDEADRMLDMGFYNDIIHIISFLPKEKQTLLFSATMPKKIRELASKILIDPLEINIAISKPAEKVVQAAFVLYDEQKIPVIEWLLKLSDASSVIIFASTKSSVRELAKALSKIRENVQEIHSDLEQQEREQVLRNFKNKKTEVLVATDIISRGIDIDSIGMVINFDVPQDAEDYIHRVGRTARAAAEGEAVTLINPKDQNRFAKIENLVGSEIRKVPLPKSLGDGPEYKPNSRKKRSFSTNRKSSSRKKIIKKR
ncbi:MAG: DEAD/DEAH box helicase [Bacteroidota bacterium]